MSPRSEEPWRRVPQELHESHRNQSGGHTGRMHRRRSTVAPSGICQCGCPPTAAVTAPCPGPGRAATGLPVPGSLLSRRRRRQQRWNPAAGFLADSLRTQVSGTDFSQLSRPPFCGNRVSRDAYLFIVTRRPARSNLEVEKSALRLWNKTFLRIVPFCVDNVEPPRHHNGRGLCGGMRGSSDVVVGDFADIYSLQQSVGASFLSGGRRHGWICVLCH